MTPKLSQRRPVVILEEEENTDPLHSRCQVPVEYEGWPILVLSRTLTLTRVICMR